MKRLLTNMTAIAFLALFLPYTMTLLINGRQGIHKEEVLPELEYEVLSCMMQEDCSWMADGTLDLMAVLYRTECVRKGQETGNGETGLEVYDGNYSRMYDAVGRTQGQVVTIGGAYKELPYHAVSAGRTREGVLLGEAYAYVLAVECPEDKEAGEYLKRYQIPQEGLAEALGQDFSAEGTELQRDSSDYVSHVRSRDKEWQGEAFRSLLHLPSSCFYMEESDDGIMVTVKGNGHGFGISLYTADCMVQEGAGLTEIIQKFYRDAECITIP